jgi:hypothetical protein
MGYNTAFITAEMAAHKVVKRIGSNLLDLITLPRFTSHSIKLKLPDSSQYSNRFTLNPIFSKSSFVSELVSFFNK